MSRIVVIGATGHVGSYWAEFERRVGADHAAATREHVGRGVAASIQRAREVLGYRPRFSALDALRESLRRMQADGLVDVPEF